MALFKRGYGKSQTQESQDLETLEYRSSIGPRTATTTNRSSSLSRRRSGSHGDLTGGTSLKIYSEMGSATVPIGITSEQVQTAAKSFVQSTAKEKRDMQDLNDRLGNYLNRVKGLEEQNRRLVTDLEDLRNRWGKDTADIKFKFAAQLKDARKRLDDAGRQRAELDVQLARLQDDLTNDVRVRYDEIINVRRYDKERMELCSNQLAEHNAEMDLLRKRVRVHEDEIKRYGVENRKLTDDVHKSKLGLDEETVSRIDYQNQAQTLVEELEFLRRLHETEMKELQALLGKEPVDSQQFFKNELALAVRDIRGEYELIAQANKADMESWYKLKVTEAQNATKGQNVQTTFQREEIKRMRDAISDLRGKLTQLDARNGMLEKQVQELNYQLSDDQRQYETALNDRDYQLKKVREECQSLVAEMQSLLDTKMMLDAEIAIYRKMLEGEETRASGNEGRSGQEERTTRHRTEPPPRPRQDYRPQLDRKETKEETLRSSGRAKDKYEIKTSPEPQPPPRRQPEPEPQRPPPPLPPPPPSIVEPEEQFRTSEEVTLTRSVQEMHVSKTATFQQNNSQPLPPRHSPVDMAPKPAILGPAELPRSPKSAFRNLLGKPSRDPPTEYYGTVYAANNFDAGKDADAIRKALGKTLGADDKTVVSILCNRSNMQRQQIKSAYTKMFGKDLAKELSDKMRGDVKNLVAAIVTPPAEFDASEIRKAMKGPGTDESVLIEILTPRSSSEIYAIRDAYRRMFNRELEKDLASETTGKFRKLLVSIGAGYRDENNSVTDLFKARQDAQLLHQGGPKEFSTYDSAFTNVFTKDSFTQLQLLCQEYKKISGQELDEVIEKELSGDTGKTLVALVKCVKNTPQFFAERLHKSMKDDTSGAYKQGLLILVRKPQ